MKRIPKKVKHHLILAGLSKSNDDMLNKSQPHPLTKLIQTLVSLSLVIGVAYFFVFHH